MTGPVVNLTPPNLLNGCDAPRCHDPHTVMLHPHHGRLCSDHITIPPGAFRADLAADMVALGRIDAAWRYLAGWLEQETTRRFGAAVAALDGAA